MQPSQGFPAGSVVKNPPAKARGVIVAGSVPGREDPLEEGVAARPGVLAWRIPWTEEPGGLHSLGSHSQARLEHECVRRLATLSAQSATLFPRLYSGVTMSAAQAALRFK